MVKICMKIRKFRQNLPRRRKLSLTYPQVQVQTQLWNWHWSLHLEAGLQIDRRKTVLGRQIHVPTRDDWTEQETWKPRQNYVQNVQKFGVMVYTVRKTCEVTKDFPYHDFLLVGLGNVLIRAETLTKLV